MTCQYYKTMLIQYFNLTVDNKSPETFMNAFDLECLTKKPTCFQSSIQTCRDLILTNKKYFFKNTDVIEVANSDQYSLLATALKGLLLKANVKTQLYQDFNSFNTNHLKEDLDNNLKT